MKEMYPAMVNSVATTIMGAINATDTSFYVLDDSRIPEPPNLLVIGENSTLAETMKLVFKDGNKLTVERGFQCNPKAWDAGTTISRNFTAYDHDVFIENIELLDSEQTAQGLVLGEISEDAKAIKVDTEQVLEKAENLKTATNQLIDKSENLLEDTNQLKETDSKILEKVTRLETDLNTDRAEKLDFIDVLLSSRASENSVDELKIKTIDISEGLDNLASLMAEKGSSKGALSTKTVALYFTPTQIPENLTIFSFLGAGRLTELEVCADGVSQKVQIIVDGLTLDERAGYKVSFAHSIEIKLVKTITNATTTVFIVYEMEG